MDKEKEKVVYERIKVLYEKAFYEEAINECQTFINQTSFYYYDILPIYLKLMMYFERYYEVAEYLRNELSMPYVPIEVELVLKDIDNELKQRNKLHQPFIKRLYDEEMIEEMLSGDYVNQELAINFLETTNHFDYIEALKAYMVKEDADPVLKTRGMHLIILQGIKEPIQIVKNGQIYYLNENQTWIDEMEFFIKAKLLIEEVWFKEPSMQLMMVDYLRFYLQYDYPEAPLLSELNLVVSMLYAQLNRMQQQQVNWADIESKLGITKDEIMPLMKQFH